MRETKKTNIMATYRSMKDNAYNQKLNWTNAYDRSKCNYLSWLDNLENCFIPKNSLLLKLCNQSHLMNIIGEERFYTITNIWQLHICCKCHYKVGVIHENYCITFCCQQYMIQITDKHRYYNPLWWLLQEIQRDRKYFLYPFLLFDHLVQVFNICFYLYSQRIWNSNKK